MLTEVGWVGLRWVADTHSRAGRYRCRLGVMRRQDLTGKEVSQREVMG